MDSGFTGFSTLLIESPTTMSTLKILRFIVGYNNRYQTDPLAGLAPELAALSYSAQNVIQRIYVDLICYRKMPSLALPEIFDKLNTWVRWEGLQHLRLLELKIQLNYGFQDISRTSIKEHFIVALKSTIRDKFTHRGGVEINVAVIDEQYI